MKANLNDLAVFNEVVSCGSFSGAGRSLGLPPSAVSRRVARLEETLGTRLLNRTTRKLGLTEAGRIYYEQTANISSAAEEAERALAEMSSEPRGTVNVTTPPDEGGLMWPVWEEFLQAHPKVHVNLIQIARFVDIVAEGIDVAIRSGPPPDSTQFSAHRLIESGRILVASPEYLARKGTPRRIEDLSEHDCILMGPMTPQGRWPLVSPEGKVVRVPVDGRVTVSSLDVARGAAEAGMGIAIMIDVYALPELSAGTLVEVLPGCFGPPTPVWAIAPVRRHRSPAVRAMLDHLVQAFPRRLEDLRTRTQARTRGRGSARRAARPGARPAKGS